MNCHDGFFDTSAYFDTPDKPATFTPATIIPVAKAVVAIGARNLHAAIQLPTIHKITPTNIFG